MKDCALFESLTERQVKKFVLLANQKRFEDGEPIVSAADVSREMYVILDGAAKVVAKTKTGQKRVMEKLAVGDVIGELAFLNNVPRTADVIATGSVEALILSPGSIEKVINADSKISAKVYKNLSRLVATRLSSATQRVA